MIPLQPVSLEGYGVRLEPMTRDHHDDLVKATSDGRLWELLFTNVPDPEGMRAYIDNALAGAEEGHMLPWVVRDRSSALVVGSTRYHDVIAEIDRVEIGYTWYGRRWQRTHVNTGCKRLLLEHAFDHLGCHVVGLRTDILNHVSQRAIEALGARKDGVIRHHRRRRDGTVGDTVMYSILSGEWPMVKKRLEERGPG